MLCGIIHSHLLYRVTGYWQLTGLSEVSSLLQYSRSHLQTGLKALPLLSGFGGSWGVDGKHYNEKMELLNKEGVKFDSKGRVKGPVFEGFTPV